MEKTGSGFRMQCQGSLDRASSPNKAVLQQLEFLRNPFCLPTMILCQYSGAQYIHLPQTELRKSCDLSEQIGIFRRKGFLRQPPRNQHIKAKRQELLERYYIPHHQKLSEAVEDSLLTNDHCLIIDGQSFPALPLP